MIFFYLLVAVMPLVRHQIWADTQFAGITLNKYLGVVCLLVGLSALAARATPPRFFQTVQSRVFVVFGLATIASFIIGGSDISLEISSVANWVSFLLLFFVTLVLVDSIERLRWTVLALIGGVAFASLHLIREWIGTGLSRPGWVTGDPNYFALSALLCLPLAALLAQDSRIPWERAYCLGCLIVTLTAFALSGSRGGFVGLILGFAAALRHSRHRLRYFTLGALGIGTLLLIVPSSPLDRLLNPRHFDQESADVRTALFWAGIDMFQQNFLTGVGVGNYKALVHLFGGPDMRLENLAHNTYVEVAAEMGILGLLAFMAIFGFSFLSLRRVRIDTQAREPGTTLINTTARSLEAGLVGAAGAILFLSALHVRIMWFVLILSMCLPPLSLQARKRRSAHSRAASPGIRSHGRTGVRMR
jgi:O-antigen ligase